MESVISVILLLLTEFDILGFLLQSTTLRLLLTESLEGF